MSGLEAGTIIGERYRVTRRLGAGTVGTVYEVEHVDIGARFAMKILGPRLIGVPGVTERFAREARAAASLDDPRIVRVTDFGRHGDRPYLVMELLEGRTLGAAMLAGALDARAVVELLMDVLDGLGAAHARGIIHRDLKPENLFVVERNGARGAKILDFGLAKIAVPQDELRTAEGTVFGTPRYMAPEQASGEPVDARADLYSVGVILFELLSGKPPFVGTSASEVLRKHVFEPAPQLRLPAGTRGLEAEAIAAAVGAALEKNPAERPASASALRALLEQALGDDEGEAPTRIRPSPFASVNARPEGAQKAPRVVAPRRLHRQAAAAGLGALLVFSWAILAPGRARHEAVPLDPSPPAMGADDGSSLALASGPSAPEPARASPETPPKTPDVARSTETGSIPSSERKSGSTRGPSSEAPEARALSAALLEVATRRDPDEAMRARLLQILETPGALADPRLHELVERWADAREAALIELFLSTAARAAPTEAAPLFARLAKRAPTFALRRRAYEALESSGETELLDRAAYLVDELRRNGTDSCTIRRWYVERIAALRDPETVTVLLRERGRRGGFLGLERKGTCLASIVNEALEEMLPEVPPED